MAQDGVGPVGLLDCRNLLGAELDIDRREELLEWCVLVAPTIGAVTPGACRIHAQTICVGVTPCCFATFSTASATARSSSRKYIFRANSSVCARLVAGAPPCGLAVAREEAARQRTPWNQRDPLVDAERDHLALFLTGDATVSTVLSSEAAIEGH